MQPLRREAKIREIVFRAIKGVEGVERLATRNRDFGETQPELLGFLVEVPG